MNKDLQAWIYTSKNSLGYDVQIWIRSSTNNKKVEPRRLTHCRFLTRVEGHEWAEQWLDASEEYSSLDRVHDL